MSGNKDELDAMLAGVLNQREEWSDPEEDRLLDTRVADARCEHSAGGMCGKPVWMRIARRLLEQWSYVGVLSIELFDEGGKLRVNELAPRVHNSGHWSQDAGVTAQVSNHIRASTDTRPGNTRPVLYAGMVNLLGREPGAALLQAEDVNLHWYTKSVRSRRKVGHINVQAKDRARLQQRLAELEAALYPEGEPL